MNTTRIIKEQEIFFGTDTRGDVPRDEAEELVGLFYHDTRYLSKWRLTLDDLPPVLLSSDTEEGYLHDIWLTNPELVRDGQVVCPRGLLAIHRQAVVDGGLLERVCVTNHHRAEIDLELAWEFAVDFRDIFALRAAARQCGAMSRPEIGAGSWTIGYQGLDGLERRVRIEGAPQPSWLGEGRMLLRLGLAPGATEAIEAHVIPVVDRETQTRGSAATASIQANQGAALRPGVCPFSFGTAKARLETAYLDWETACTRITTDSTEINRVLARSLRDLRLLTTHAVGGPYLVAGIPKFATLFGRDSILAALQTLMLQPELAKGTLRALAALQGRIEESWRDEQPGKILHEMRRGELANLGVVPFGRYYGSIDSTLLFICLLAATYRWLGDRTLLEELAEPFALALDWLEVDGDPDGDGYLEYMRQNADGTLRGGLVNQGWKDSNESIVFADGRKAAGPIALVEVQSYAYSAKCCAAEVCETLGDAGKAARLRGEAEELKVRFNRDYWLEREGFFALALDRKKRPVDAVTSNPGHALWAGIVADEHLEAFVEGLTSSRLLTPWGLRTLAEGQAAYSPVSYHNGSIWPHDNALIAMGLKRYGFDAAASAVAGSVLRAATHFPDGRLPELYCGFASRRPVAFPDACAPQAWASGSIFQNIQTMLGMFPAKGGKELSVRPCLLPEIGLVKVENLQIGPGRLDLLVRRRADGDCAVEVLRNEADIKVCADFDREMPL